MSSEMSIEAIMRAVAQSSNDHHTDELTEVELHTINRQAMLAGFRKALTQRYASMFGTLMDEGVINHTNPVFTSMQAHCKAIDDAKANPFWWLVTVNPKPEISLSDFCKTIEKMVSKKWIHEYHYAFEQRGKTPEEMGKGFHVHCLIKRSPDKKRSDIFKEMRNTCKHLCDVEVLTFLNFRYVNTEADLKKMYKYLTGEKNFDESRDNSHKKASCELDILWREDHGLQPMYHSHDAALPLLLGQQ